MTCRQMAVPGAAGVKVRANGSLDEARRRRQVWVNPCGSLCRQKIEVPESAWDVSKIGEWVEEKQRFR